MTIYHLEYEHKTLGHVMTIKECSQMTTHTVDHILSYFSHVMFKEQEFQKKRIQCRNGLMKRYIRSIDKILTNHLKKVRTNWVIPKWITIESLSRSNGKPEVTFLPFNQIDFSHICPSILIKIIKKVVEEYNNLAVTITEDLKNNNQITVHHKKLMKIINEIKLIVKEHSGIPNQLFDINFIYIKFEMKDNVRGTCFVAKQVEHHTSVKSRI